MLESKDYLVIQEGGQGNSLGRIIFRFDNDFSVFLHDTSSKEIFSRDTRGVSHGCVRVEKPFDLAVFMLKDKDEQIIDKIKYSMIADVSNLDKTDEDENTFVDTLDHSKLISSLPVDPQVPLFITYFTLYPVGNGRMAEYDDVYGYDHVIYDCLCNYL
jgi:murein L,D-transpeptidase YcbB/YkuD